MKKALEYTIYSCELNKARAKVNKPSTKMETCRDQIRWLPDAQQDERDKLEKLDHDLNEVKTHVEELDKKYEQKSYLPRGENAEQQAPGPPGGRIWKRGGSSSSEQPPERSGRPPVSNLLEASLALCCCLALSTQNRSAPCLFTHYQQHQLGAGALPQKRH
ncbi:hypothetical protein MATL_G00016520 [Megalops atlanticus]|uniref:Uncharacterized protein n=1 Tax=Megalops atlanticus TaxID=7932 RepID=A0A9D3QKR3_MEGAT|nr:hypothetical protein MATL_G00016520 [Megalops atlanticus]